MRNYGEKEAKRLARNFLASFKGKRISGSSMLEGGTASDAFNAMHNLASSGEPRTPILGSAPSKACWSEFSGRGISTSLLNNMIQGSASSLGFLSCLLVANEWLNRHHKLGGWFSAALHDEAVFCYPTEHAEQGAYNFQIAHAWCWALAHYRAGLCNVPVSTLFASSINIDKIWRKSAYASVKTPTNTEVFPGKELNMHKLNEIARSNNYWQ